MFSIVNIKTVEEGIIPRLKYIIKKPDPILKRIDVPQAQAFYYLEIYKEQCSDNYSEIPALLGASAQSTLSCRSFDIFRNPKIIKFNSLKFKNTVLINSAVKFIIENNNKNSFVCFVDIQAEFTAVCENLVEYVRGITVITKRKEKYNSLKNKLFFDYGVSIIITEEIPEYCLFDYIISVGYVGKMFFNYGFTYFDKEKRNAYSFKGSKIKPINEYLELMPEGINYFDFAAALFTENGCRRLSDSIYCDFKPYSMIKF